MNKTILVSGIIILFILTSFTPLTIGYNVKTSIISKGANTLYVGGSGPGNYTKIQDAIDNASDGDMVFVYAGMYIENVVVDKSINLIGEDKNTTIIDGGNSEDVVSVNDDWVTISEFTIQNSGNKYSDAGIYIDSNNNVISSNNISNNEYGLSLYKSNRNTIMDNIISNNSMGNGIDLYMSGRNNITRNNIIENYDDGIYLYGYSYFNSITFNIILDQYYGIRIQESLFTVISGNTINSNNLFGIILGYNSMFNTVQGNIISNSHFGIGIGNSMFNTIKGNAIKFNNEYGIYLDMSLFNSIIKNNILDNNINAFFTYSIRNRWIKNYWDRPRLLPKLIQGELVYTEDPTGGLRPIIWYNFDWRPALEPYDIHVFRTIPTAE